MVVNPTGPPVVKTSKPPSSYNTGAFFLQIGEDHLKCDINPTKFPKESKIQMILK